MRSCVPTYPAPNATSSAVSPVTNGTPAASRRIVTPGRGVSVETAWSSGRSMGASLK
jgi:hypothetical protein